MTRHQRLFLRRATPYITGALIIAFVITIYGVVGRMEYDTLKMINNQ